MGDYVPKSFDNLKPWLEGIKTGIKNDGLTCGQSAGTVTADTALVDSLLAPVGDALTQETAAMDARGTAETMISTNMPGVRSMLNRYKSATGWTDGMAQAWDVNSPARSFDMNTHGPTVRAQSRTGMVLVRGSKPGFTSVTVQMRPDGTADWIDIGVKISRFPFIDITAPQTPSKPEKREYRALGYVGDEQVGQPSAAVTAVFGV